jgi:glutaredoxin
MTPTLSLYHLPYCPYCHKVRRAAAALGIELELRDISNDRAARRMLNKKLGRSTVPVLRIETRGGVELLPESDDIVAYLQDIAARQTRAA